MRPYWHNRENIMSGKVRTEILRELCQEFQQCGSSREWETHLPIFQCLASSENMIDAQYIFINRVNELINDQTMHKWFRLERTGKWVRKPWWFCFALKLSKGMVPIVNKKNKTCDRSLYLSICFGGLKQFLSKYNKWKECCLCKWNTKKKNR